MSGAFGTPQNSTDPNLQDCATDPAHNQWVTAGLGPAGRASTGSTSTRASTRTTCRSAPRTCSPSGSSASSGNARVYGSGRMAAYTNLDAGNQTFYFSQIEKVHAGKTLEIELFDPGESSGNAFLRFLNPDGDTYTYATFDWEADDGRNGTGVTSLQTSIGGPRSSTTTSSRSPSTSPRTTARGA